MMNKKAVTSVLLSILINISCISIAHAVVEEEKVLNVYNWVDYIAPDTVSNFEKETGIKVHYDTYEDNETLNAKLLEKNHGYDVVMPSSDWAKSQIDSGLLSPLDKGKLPNLKNIDPNFLDKIKKSDPNHAYLVPYLWGYTTIGVNVGKVVKALGKTPVPKNVWELVFNPIYTSKLKSCGIVFLDSASDIMPLALYYMGKPAYSSNVADYSDASVMLKKIRPDIKQFSSAGQSDQLLDQSICVAIGWGGDFYRARSVSKQKDDGQNIAPVIPEVGALFFMDSMAIPKGAKHPNNAHQFINYILKAKVHAEITNSTKYANPNKASLEFVDAAMANDRSLFLRGSDFNRLIAPQTLDNNVVESRERYFEKFKTDLK